MKKVILASVLAVAATSVYSAASQTYCSGGTAVSGNTAAVSTTSGQDFIKSSFTPKCSANTFVSGQDGGSYYRVGSGSAKGKTRFAGTSVGGAVVAAGACASATACVASDASNAMVSTYAATS